MEEKRIEELKNNLRRHHLHLLICFDPDDQPTKISFKDNLGTEYVLYSFKTDQFDNEALSSCLSIKEIFFFKEAIEQYKKITVKELEEGLKAVDSLIELVKNDDNKPVYFTFVDLYSNSTILYDFRKNEFDNFSFMLDNLGQNKINELIKLVFSYKYGSNDYQTISKEKNSSTMQFEDDISNDSQKKTKEQLIYDFVDEIADHGFDTEQTVINHKTGYIKVSYKFDDPIRVDCLEIYLSDLGIDKIPDNPIYLNKDLCMSLDEQKLMKLNWLFERVSKFVSDLR